MYDHLVHRWLHIPYRLHVDVVQDPPHPRATLLMIHGIGNNGHAWDTVIHQLPHDVRILTVDLLGFGHSPHPKRMQYNAHDQARSVVHTYLTLGIPEQIILVGHSLGALVAVEIAKRYPLLIRSLILVSPPFYRPEDPMTKTLLRKPDTLLRDIYKIVQKYPEDFVRVAGVAMKYKLVNDVFNVTADNVDTYMATLQAAIVNQTAMDDIEHLKLPISLIHGRLDPLVVPENLTYLARNHTNISLTHAVAGHELVHGMIPAVARAIRTQLPKS